MNMIYLNEGQLLSATKNKYKEAIMEFRKISVHFSENGGVNCF